MPRADVVEADDAYLLALDLPGVNADAVHVHYDDGVLTVSGERSQVGAFAESRLLRAERGLGRFSRQFQIGTAIDPDAIEASLDDGVLTLRVPKAEVRKARQIAVSRRAHGGASRIEASSTPDDGTSD
jgi:HSP20 family protein